MPAPQKVSQPPSSGEHCTEEAEAIESAIEQIHAPYVQRGKDGAPPDSRAVRYLRMSLPEATT